MKIFSFILIILSFLLLGAHFLREGLYFLMFTALLLPLLLIIKKPWSARIMQFALALGTFEWLVTLYENLSLRIEAGMPWVRMAIIFMVVALFAACAALLFQSKPLKKHFHLHRRQ